jgi:hypothetical protein
MMDDVYAEAIDLQPYYNDQPAVDSKHPPQPPPDDKPAKPPGGEQPLASRPGEEAAAVVAEGACASGHGTAVQ